MNRHRRSTGDQGGRSEEGRVGFHNRPSRVQEDQHAGPRRVPESPRVRLANPQPPGAGRNLSGAIWGGIWEGNLGGITPFGVGRWTLFLQGMQVRLAGQRSGSDRCQEIRARWLARVVTPRQPDGGDSRGGVGRVGGERGGGNSRLRDHKWSTGGKGGVPGVGRNDQEGRPQVRMTETACRATPPARQFGNRGFVCPRRGICKNFRKSWGAGIAEVPPGECHSPPGPAHQPRCSGRGHVPPA